MPATCRTALELRDALRRGEVSAHGLVVQAFERVKARTDLGAFISTHERLALEEARDADELVRAAPLSRRHLLPPLLGVPTAHKDLVEQRGHITTRGTAAMPHVAADEDDPIARDARAAGAISLGKTQVPEFGIAGYSENEIAAPARNPFDLSLTAGGSSGGTAAAIAAGLIPAAIASDAGGSIRIPAAACGLLGLKPGRDVVPADAERRVAELPSLAVSGPIARTASDAALLFDAMLGDRGESTLSAVRRADELGGQRIGVSLASPFEGWADVRFSPDAREALAVAAAALEARGHRVEETHIVYDARYPEAFTTVWTAALARIPFADGAEVELGALAAMFLARARSTTPDELAAAKLALQEFAEGARRQWGDYDAVLTPALAFAPPRVGAFRELGPEGDYRLQCEWAPQTSMVNVVGVPAATVPTWHTPAGLPMGVQLIGRAGSESELLQLAEQIMAGHQR